MKRPSWAIPIALLCAFALVAGACGDSDDAADLPILKFQGFPADPVGLPALVMAEEGIDVENGFHAEYLAVDSLAYLELNALLAATGVRADGFCTACLSGRYPTDIPTTGDKFLLERS